MTCSDLLPRALKDFLSVAGEDFAVATWTNGTQYRPKLGDEQYDVPHLIAAYSEALFDGFHYLERRPDEPNYDIFTAELREFQNMLHLLC